MGERMNREIKAYCPDFGPVRDVLLDGGATFIGVKEQVDHYYELPRGGVEDGTRRLKLRVEGERRELIYYRDYQEADARVSRFQLWPMPDQGLMEVLDAVLGSRVVVRAT